MGSSICEMWDRKRLTRLIIPLVIEQVLAVTIGMADTVMVSSVGEAAVSGIALVDTINILLINILAALATGGAVVAAQYIGKNNREKACESAKQLLITVTILSLILTFLVLPFKNQILRLIFGKVEISVMRNAQTYFLLSVLSYPFLAVYNAGAALYRAMGNSKVSMLIYALMNVVNVIGNALLIYQFSMGVAGAGISSLFSRALGAVIVLVLLRKPVSLIHIKSFFPITFDFHMIKNILRIGVPNGLENGMFQIGKILVQGLVASFGTAAIAADAVAGSIANLEIIPGVAIGLAMITVVGQCVGACDYEAAKKYIFKLMGLTYLSMIVLNVLTLIFCRNLVGFYHLSGESMKLSVKLLIMHSICVMTIWPCSFILPNGLRASNDVKFTMITSIVSMWVFRIFFSYFLAGYMQMGVAGVWIAMFIDWFVRAIVFCIRFASGKWKEKQYL